MTVKRAGTMEGSVAVPSGRPVLVASGTPTQPREIAVDPFRAVVFPNRVRELRHRGGYPKLMALAAALPDIPYIRLSKIERGEVVARPDELVRIARLIGTEPAELLVDVDAPGFDLAAWAEPFLDGTAVEQGEERFAIMLAASMRLRRQRDRGLTLAVLDKQFGLPPVILSRFENAQKPLGRWNDATVQAVCRMLGVKDEAALRRHVTAQYRSGELDPQLAAVGGAEARLDRTRERIAAIAAALAGEQPGQAEAAQLPASQPSLSRPPALQPYSPAAATGPAAPTSASSERRLLPVLGAPMAAGLIAATPTTAQIEAPAAAGDRSFGLRVCRATLGGGLPGHATVIVDPDRYPTAGGLAVVREGAAYRVLAVYQDRGGATKGYSVSPDLDITIDGLDPADVAAVIAASFI